jgi:hypothetical protein
VINDDGAVITSPGKSSMIETGPEREGHSIMSEIAASPAGQGRPPSISVGSGTIHRNLLLGWNTCR